MAEKLKQTTKHRKRTKIKENIPRNSALRMYNKIFSMCFRRSAMSLLLFGHTVLCLTKRQFAAA